MRMQLAALICMLFCLMLLTASTSSDTSFITAELQEESMGSTVKKSNSGRKHTGHVLVQDIRTGHGGSGEGNHGNGNTDSSSNNQPGRPLNGAGGANSRDHHRRGAGFRSTICNFNLLALAISVSLCIPVYILSLKQ